MRTLAFHATTRSVRYENGIYLYRIEDGRPRFLGPYREVRGGTTVAPSEGAPRGG
ncbi:hypothetical protein [Streptomyces sp. NPDC049906]|uniref:hypothetical protein n=1 Tax=Streptomyces sp. NPDC049906 TaxID=3155656 RepID=UPI003417645D